MSAKLIAEVASMSKGMKLREDQTLFLFMDTLKNFGYEIGYLYSNNDSIKWYIQR